MTREQQRIAIAEACGWKNIAFERPRNCDEPEWCGVIHGGHGPLADYTSDLNAAAAAENCLINTPKLEEDYYFELKRNFRATAAERCEAILKVIGKWLPCGKEEV